SSRAPPTGRQTRHPGCARHRGRAGPRPDGRKPRAREASGTPAARPLAPRPTYGAVDGTCGRRPYSRWASDRPTECVARGGPMKARRPLVGWLLIAPSLIGVTAFLILPVILAFGVSLFRWDLLGTREFTGLDNYTTLIAGGAL